MNIFAFGLTGVMTLLQNVKGILIGLFFFSKVDNRVVNVAYLHVSKTTERVLGNFKSMR